MVTWILTHDFCPWLNRWVYWIKRPIASFCIAGVAALLCAIFVKPLVAVAFCVVGSVALLGYLWPWITVRGLQCVVQFACDRVTEGDSATVSIQLTNRWPWRVWGLAIEWGGNAGESLALACVNGRSTTEFEWTFVPVCRGEYPLSPPRLVTGFPFGLRRVIRPIRVIGTLVVWPRIIPLETLLDAAETRPSDDIFSDHRIGESGDMTGTRLFRDGDSLRRVHWAQTARQGRMIVCERQAPVQSSIRVVFDSNPEVHRGEGPQGTLEWSIRIAASICAAYQREHAQVECCFGHETLPLAAGSQGLKKFLDSISRWSPPVQTPKQSCDHKHDVKQCHRIHHRNCGVFQLTVTTDIGLGHRTEHRHVHGDQRWIVLASEAFDGQCLICGSAHAIPDHRSIVLDRKDGIADDFRRKWRHVCHVG